MIVIDQFNERFYFALFGNSFLAHSRCDFARVAFNASDEGMTERVDFRTVIKGFEDHCFATSVTAASDKCDFTRF